MLSIFSKCSQLQTLVSFAIKALLSGKTLKKWKSIIWQGLVQMFSAQFFSPLTASTSTKVKQMPVGEYQIHKSTFHTSI